ASLARPGGNVTGFIMFEYSLAGKWLQLLKQIAPNVTRAAVLRDPSFAAGVGQFAVIQSVAPSIGMEVSAINLRDPAEIERAIARFAGSPNGGLIVTTSASSFLHRELIIALAARHKLPAIYYRRYFATVGGLISYGYDVLQQFRGAADYVDRILRGKKPAELPVQAPTKYELVINLKAARLLALTVADRLLATADEESAWSGARSSRCSAARRPRGRSRRGRSSRSCRRSVFSARALPHGAAWSPLSCSGCANSVISRIAPLRSSIAGPRVTTNATRQWQPNSSH